MDAEAPRVFGRIKVEWIWLLSPLRDPILNHNTISTLAVVLRTEFLNILIHAVSSPDFYQPFTKQCTLILTSGAGDDPVPFADLIMRNTGALVSRWNWIRSDFSKEGGIPVDLSALSTDYVRSDESQTDELISIFHSPDVIKIMGGSSLLDRLLSDDRSG